MNLDDFFNIATPFIPSFFDELELDNLTTAVDKILDHSPAPPQLQLDLEDGEIHEEQLGPSAQPTITITAQQLKEKQQTRSRPKPGPTRQQESRRR